MPSLRDPINLCLALALIGIAFNFALAFGVI